MIQLGSKRFLYGGVRKESANNLKTVVVNLNKAVDKETVNAANVRLYNSQNASQSVTVGLSEDGKKIYLTSATQLVQGADYKLVVEKVKTTDNREVKKYDESVKVLDNTVPETIGVTVTSPKTIDIEFNEPISNFPTTSGVLTNKVQLDGIDLFVSKIDSDKLATEGKVTLTLSTALTAGEHKVKILGLTDYANFPVAAKEFTVNVGEDKTAPEVASAQAIAKDKVKVVFSEPVEESTIVGNSNLKVKVGATTYNLSAERKDAKTYEFTLANGAQFDLGAVVEANFVYKNIKDLAGNNVADEKTFKFQAKDDTTLPTVSSHSVNSSNNIEVTFSEDVTITDASKIKVYDKDNKEVAVSSVSPKVTNSVTSKTTYIITLTNGSSLKGNYTVKFGTGAVKDLSIRENALASTEFTAVLVDKVAPVVSSVKYVNETSDNILQDGDNTRDSKVTIYFNESMDVATLSDKANYIVRGKSLSDYSNATVSVGSDAKSVTITFDGTPTNELDFTAGSGDGVKVLNIKDVTGNRIADGSFNTALTLSAFESSVAFDTAIEKADLTAKNKVRIYANDGYQISNIDRNKFTFNTDNGVEPIQVSSASVATDGSYVDLTLTKELTADVKYDLNGNDTIADGEVVVLSATEGAITFTDTVKTQADATVTLNDKVKASLVVADEDNDGKVDVTDEDKVTLTFDEYVYADATDLKAALVIKNKDGVRLGTSAYSVSVASADTTTNKDVVITFAPSATAYEGEYTIALSDNVVLKDAAHNNAKDIATLTTETINVVSQATVALNEATEAVTEAENAANALKSDGTETSANISEATEKIVAATSKVTGLPTGTEKTALQGKLTTATGKVTAATNANKVAAANGAIADAKTEIGTTYEFEVDTDLTEDQSEALKSALDTKVDNDKITLDVTKTDDDNYSVVVSHDDGGTPVTVNVEVTAAS